MALDIAVAGGEGAEVAGGGEVVIFSPARAGIGAGVGDCPGAGEVVFKTIKKDSGEKGAWLKLFDGTAPPRINPAPFADAHAPSRKLNRPNRSERVKKQMI